MTAKASTTVKLVIAGCLVAGSIAAVAFLRNEPWAAAVEVAAASSDGAAQSQSDFKQQLLAQLKKRSESFTITYKGNTSELVKNLSKLTTETLDTDDYLAYILKSYRYSSNYTSKTATVRYSVQYHENAAQTDYVNKKVTATLKTIITPGMNAHQKVKAIHDWIVLNVAYDESLQAYSAYEALTSGKTVCQGYSLLAYKMLNEAGIPTRIAEGTVRTGAHAWNLIQLDGKWYHLDATWDDPVPDKKGRTTYNYYLVTDKQLRQDHAWTKTYPSATTVYSETLTALMKKETSKDKAAFYAKLEKDLGYQYLQDENKAATVEQLAAKVKQAIKRGEASVKVRYLRGDSLAEDLEQLFEAVPSLRSYKASYTPFGTGNSTNDIMLELKFTTSR